MTNQTFRKYNLLTGWAVFLVAAVTYLLTMEPTVSWWDCGEFIASAYKLEVGHPPGAPFFILVARVFSMFAGDPANVAKMVNSVSAFSSAFTILFLFWSITHLALKTVKKSEQGYRMADALIVLGSAAAGALIYTFSDSFWFSAVEGEVYAMSSLFTAVVFWAILKWETKADDPASLRWIIFIAFLMGLSVGVHLLNLLAIPAIGFIYYFKKYTPTKKGVLVAFLLTAVLLGALMYGIIPGVVLLASWFELFFINLIGLPYHFGLVIFLALLTGLIAWGLIETKRRGSVLWNTVILAGAFFIIGYSTYGIILIRSNADTPMEQNNPDMVFMLKRYIDREQYGDRPLVHGQYFNAPAVDQEPVKPLYAKVDGRYEILDYRNKTIYDKRFLTIFPRMYSPSHAPIYREWARIKGVPIQITGRGGQPETINKPTFSENLRFFFSYQLGHMYFRYFMWNFVGRQNDNQSHGGILDGNWISGIKLIDEARLGPLDYLPESAAENKGRNVYYFLPLLLGIIGAVYQYRKKQTDFWVITLLFVYTGIAIVVYLNQYPDQPRERDYSFVGSFYAFSIWAGLGLLALYRGLTDGLKGNQNKLKSLMIASPLIILGLLVPVQMASQNWDDHDRSNRYTARDFAYNYLNSCAPNAIIFTNGDNDTFPLWYAQEVEGIRTDVRVICLPYLATDWYIDQMKRKAYDSDPVPFSLEYEKYREGERNYMPVFDLTTDTIDLKSIVAYIASDREDTKRKFQDGTSLDIVPGRHYRVQVDSAKVVANGTVPPEDAHLIVPAIEWTMPRNILYKNDLMILDLIASNNWERPIYFTSIIHENILGLQDYFRMDGYAYRLVPIKNEGTTGLNAFLNTGILYENMMNKYRWGNMDSNDIYVDFYTRRTSIIIRLRHKFVQLATKLYEEGNSKKSVEVLDKAMEVMSPRQFEYDIFIASIAEAYYMNGAMEKANRIMEAYANNIYQELRYLLSLQQSFGQSVSEESNRMVSIIQEILRITMAYGQDELSSRIEAKIKDLATSAE